MNSELPPKEEGHRSPGSINPEDAKNISECIRNITLAIAILFGGGWTLLEFSRLFEQERALASLQIDKLRAAEIEGRLIPVLNIEIEEQFLISESDDLWLVATVVVQNPGLDGTTLDISTEPFRLAKVTGFDADGHTIVGPIFSTTKLKLRSSNESSDGKGRTASVTHVTVFPGRSTRIPFIFKLSEHGIYYIEFRAQMTEKSRLQWIENGAPEDLNLNWAASKYISTAPD